MPWSNNRPTSDRYRGPRSTHAAERASRAKYHDPSHLCGYCGGPLGPMGPNLHLAHDPTGTRILGFWHQRCNQREAAKRARARQLARTPKLRW